MMNLGLRSSERIKNRRVESVLPDDTVIDILLRVPVKDVLRCRCVCIRWKNLTSTRNFIDLHSRRSPPIILVEDPIPKKRRFNRVLFHKWWETRSVIHKLKCFPEYWIYISQAGFVVFSYLNNYQSSLCFTVHNPVYREGVRIFIPRRFGVAIYGIFFHPNLNEYCLLFALSMPWYSDKKLKLLNLGTEPYWRGLNNPWSNRPKFSSSCSVFIDQCLYWLVEFEERVKDNGCYDVMEFDTPSEEFRLLPCPIPETLEGRHFDANLLIIDGLLSLVRISLIIDGLHGELFVINIWTLKDRVEQLWTSSKYIIKNQGFPNPNPRWGRTQALAVVGKELVVRSGYKLFVCNLDLGIIRNLGKKNYVGNAQFLPHVLTLASLKNCKTKIYLEHNDWEDATAKKCQVSDTLDDVSSSSS